MSRNKVTLLFKGIFVPSCFLLYCLFSSASGADSGTLQGAQGDSPPGPEAKIVDRWRGTWAVTAVRRHPGPVQEVTYEETFQWVLDGRYLRSETSRKSDGGKSMSMYWYDMLSQSYRYVIFDSSGLTVELPPPTWDESTQTMRWESSFFSPFSYTGRATFTGQDKIDWKSLWKDWKGTVILDLEGTSIRQE